MSSSVVYNGSAQTSTYENTALYTAENATGENVGNYTVTFTLTDADNYEKSNITEKESYA